jgi:hypothetical protein
VPSPVAAADPDHRLQLVPDVPNTNQAACSRHVDVSRAQTEHCITGAAALIGRLRLRSWETDEGERRSVVKVEADEVAPSLQPRDKRLIEVEAWYPTRREPSELLPRGGGHP